MLAQLWQSIGLEEFDYSLLMSALSGLQNPRQKVTALLKQGHILRVKKGLYVWGPLWRRRPVQLEILANLIYGPSLVSGDYALSLHGLIPEGVSVVTSSGPKAPKDFNTPLGVFRYQRIPVEYHSLGMNRVECHSTGFLLASPERAVCDKLLEIPGLYRPSRSQLWTLLIQELRMDPELILGLDRSLVADLALSARSARLRQLAEILTEQGVRP